MKKIAILGNMNNIPSVIGRVLVDKGYDVTLFFLNEFEHFKPESDAFQEIKGLKRFELGWDKDDIVNLTRNHILEKIKGFDFYIGVEWAPAILFKAGLSLNMFYAMGTDMSLYPFYKLNRFPPPVWHLKYFLLSKQQSYGIKYAKYISMNKSSDFLEGRLNQIKSHGKRIVGIPYLYMEQYTQENLAKSKYKNEFDEIRKKYDFIIFHHIRHEWHTNKGTIHDKGNDILFFALQNIIKDNPNKKIALMTLGYGADFEMSKSLCNELDLEKNVKWFPSMEKKHLLYGLQISDVFVGQLKDKFSGYTSLFEALAMSKLVIHNGFENVNDLYPMLVANDTTTLVKQLNKCVDYQVDFKELGKQGFEWFEKNGYHYPINEVINAIESNTKAFSIQWGRLYCKIIDFFIIAMSQFEKVIFRLSNYKKSSFILF